MARIADFRSPAARLDDALDVLATRWKETQQTWDDGNSHNVEEKHLRPLGREAVATMQAARQWADLLARAQRECEAS